MEVRSIPVPEVYKESADFRFFLDWFDACLTRCKHDTENLADLYDALKCPSWLLWMLCDTIGYKYDDRLPAAFNRLVVLYFMSMIRNKGSKDGMTLAAQVNLAQFDILDRGADDAILYDRLENTAIPVNAVNVLPHTEDGYIDVVYFSTEQPVDACIEYVRPIGMYVFQSAGVRADARTKISVDARLTNTNDLDMGIGPTRVGHYSRKDYASLQKMRDEEHHIVNESDTRRGVWYRNSEYESAPSEDINPGYRAIYSLQACNNEHIVRSLIRDDTIFEVAYGPQDVNVHSAESGNWNLCYNKSVESAHGSDVYTLDPSRSSQPTSPKPAVNPIMGKIGDVVYVSADGETKYTHVKSDGTIELKDLPGNDN